MIDRLNFYRKAGLKLPAMLMLLGLLVRAQSQDLTWQIDMTDADRWNYRYLGDMLDRMPGIWVRDLGLVGQFAPFRLDGANPNQSILCLDGEPINESWTGAVDLNWIPTEMIERLEIYPETNPFGLSPSGGIVNLVTKQLQSKKPTSTFFYRTAGNGFSDLDIHFAQPVFSRIVLSAGVTTKKFGEDISGVAYKGQAIRALITYRILERLYLRYQVIDQTHEGDLPYVLTLPDFSATFRYPERKISANDQRITLESTYWNLKSTFFLNLSDARYKFNSASSDSLASRTTTNYTVLHGAVDGHPRGLPVILGFRFTKNSLIPTDRNKLEAKEQITSLHLDPKFRKVAFIADLDAFHFRNQAARFSISLGTDLQLTQNWTTGFFVSRRLRLPSLAELSGYMLLSGPAETSSDYQFLHADTILIPNENLKPEEADQIGLHLAWEPISKIKTTTRLFLRNTNNLIQFQADKVSPCFVNAGKAKFQGIEFLAKAGPFRHFELFSVLNYLHAVDGEDAVLIERPNIWGSGSLAWSHSFFEDDLKVHLELAIRYRSEFWTLVQGQPFLAGDPGMMLDFKANCTVMQQADIFLAFDNFLNADLMRAYGFPLAGRTFRYGLRWTVFD